MGAQIVFDASVPIAQQVADYLADASGEELATTAGELFLAYLLAPVVFKLVADIAVTCVRSKRTTCFFPRTPSSSILADPKSPFSFREAPTSAFSCVASFRRR